MKEIKWFEKMKVNFTMKKLFLFILIFSSVVLAQSSIKGKVVDENDRPLYGVNVFIPAINTGAQTNFTGAFEIKNISQKTSEILLKISYVGYRTKEINIKLPLKDDLFIKLEIDPIHTDEVVVTENREGTFLKNSPVKIEVITSKQIQKNYALDLTQTLAFTPGVKVQDNCGVCGTSDIRLQGLEGQYSQILINGRPIMSNLGTVYGLMGINTSSIKQIEIVRGPGTILYGPEAVSGTINVILKDPTDLPAYSYKMEATSHLEHSISLSNVQKWDDAALSLSGDYAGNYNRLDENRDGFTDIPLFQRFSFLGGLLADLNDGASLNVTGRYYYEDRFGGQIGWDRKRHRGGDQIYGESIFTNRQELFGGYAKKLSQNLELQLNFSEAYHNQNSYYGSTFYKADQLTAYTDALFILRTGSSNVITVGTAYKYDRYDDNSPATTNAFDPLINQPADYHITSIFVQDEINVFDELTVLTGLRYNYHNLQKSIWQPRISLKITPGVLSAIRLSFGTGFRTVNLFTEEHASFTGARRVEISEQLNPERSKSGALSFLHNIDFLSQFLKFEASAHITYFSNQIVPDYNSDPQKIIYSNLNGHSISRGFQASADYENFLSAFKIFLSYEFLEAFKVENNFREDIEFNPKHTINLQLDYRFRNLDLEMSISGKWVGRQKLPLFTKPFPRPVISDPYTQWNISFNKQFRNFKLKAGMKNIFNYVQPSPLIDPLNPFGENFDTVYIYGPLHGREVFAGIEFSIN